MLNNVKVVAIIMLIIGGIVGYGGAAILNSNTTNNVETIKVADVQEERNAQKLAEENMLLKAEISDLKAALEETRHLADLKGMDGEIKVMDGKYRKRRCK